MSVHFVRFRSLSIATHGEFYLVMPDKGPSPFTKDNPHYNRPTKTIICLHGYTGDSTDWLVNCPVDQIALDYNLAIVMPFGGINFYVDRPATGRKWGTFVGEELINYLRDTYGLAMEKENTMIAGVSMGGFGCLHTAFAYPQTFGSVIALSSALIIHQLKNMKPGMNNPMANYEYYEDTFGDLSKAEESDYNPEVLFKKNVDNGITNPRVYMACGTEDFLYQPNIELKEFFAKENADYKYEEGPGVHHWSFWVPYFKKGLEYLLEGDK